MKKKAKNNIIKTIRKGSRTMKIEGIKPDPNWIPGGYKYVPEKSKEKKLLESIIRKMKKAENHLRDYWRDESMASGMIEAIIIVKEKLKSIK